MSKKRKTKREKIASDLKKQLFKSKIPEQITNEPEKISIKTFSIDMPKTTNLNPEKKVNNAKNYSYVLKDIKKTVSITLIIFLLDISLFFLLKNNILSLKVIGL